MNRLSLIATAALFAAAAHAQCLNTAGGTAVTLNPTLTWPADDEGLSAPMPLGFAFPIPGSGTFTHVAIDSNGAVYLTNGGAPVGTTNYGTADMAGFAGDSPRIAAFWDDLEGPRPTWSVTMDTSVAGRCAINWIDVNEYVQTPTFSCQVTLYSTGDVDFSYSAPLNVINSSATVGISAGNGLAATSSDLTSTPTSTVAALYETFSPGGFDLSDNTLRILPSGSGYTAIVLCGNPAAAHTEYGTGCYEIAGASFYELFPDAILASAGLSNQSLTLTPAGSQYLAIWGGGTYVAPTGAAVPVFTTPTDDGEQVVTPSVPFPTASGPQTNLRVHSNGLVSWGALPQTFLNTQSYTPTVEAFLAAGNAAVWAWHDWAEQDTGSGRIKREEIGGVLYVTWDNVDSWPLNVSNNGTMQFQFNLATGSITLVWQTISNNASSSFGSAHLVGWSPAGSSLDPGSISLATALPLLTAPDISRMALSASPAPISTATSGTVVTFTTDNIPELVPGSGLHVGLHIMSLGQIPAPGLDLGFIGAPGCAGLVQSLDFTQAMVGVTSTQTVTFSLPAGIASGLTLYSQSAGLFTPGSLPGGLNAFGLLTSNGIASLISDH